MELLRVWRKELLDICVSGTQCISNRMIDMIGIEIHTTIIQEKRRLNYYVFSDRFTYKLVGL